MGIAHARPYLAGEEETAEDALAHESAVHPSETAMPVRSDELEWRVLM